MNLDIQAHTLLFYFFRNNEAFSVGELGPLMPNESEDMTFDFEHERIDYYCQFHRNERGSVIIFQDVALLTESSIVLEASDQNTLWDCGDCDDGGQSSRCCSSIKSLMAGAIYVTSISS
jgi:hypothetical protein